MSNLLVSGALNTFLAILLAILILLVMITVHEFGHFVSGRILGFRIDEFAIGFGPKLLRVKSRKSGTYFSVRAIPLGGYCAFSGEDEEGEEEGSFNRQPPWKRIIVLISGALMNYVAALVFAFVCLAAFGLSAYRVNSVRPADTPTEQTLVAGDVILRAEGVRIYLATDLITALGGKKQGDEVEILVLSAQGEEITRQVTLRADCDFENYSQVSKVWRALGADTYTAEDGTLYWDLSAAEYRMNGVQTAGAAFGYTWRMAGTIFRVLGELFTGRLGLDAIGGPVTTIKLTSEMAAQGWQSFLTIASYIGVNLAVFNLLPIPALDGSKVVFCLIEWIFRKPVPRRAEAIIHAVGLVLILGFAILADILQFV